MHDTFGRFRGRLDSQRDSDTGDTLIEVLVTIVIMSIAVVALLASLLTSTGASTTHRGIANLDGILVSFAESSRYQIQTQPEDGTTGPLYQACATSYPLVSDPYPSSAPSGTPVTMFVTGLAANKALTLKVGGTAVTPTSGGTTDGSGNSTIVFSAPASGGTVSVSDGTTTGQSRIPFAIGTVVAGITATTFQNYKVSSTVQAYPAGTTPCTSVTKQQITLGLTDPDPHNSSTDSISFVVGDFSPNPVVVSVSSRSSAVPATVTYVANVTDQTGTPIPTGTVAWSFAAGTPGTPTCANSNLASGTAQCQIHPTYGQQGAFVVTATYTNPSSTYPSGMSAQSSYTLTKAVPPVNVSWASNATPGSLTFTAQVVGGTGVGGGPVSPGAGSPAMTWQLLATPPTGPPTAPTCDSQTGPDSTTATTVNYTCTITTTIALDNYSVSANYAGNTNYANALGQQAWYVPQVAVSGGSNPTGTVTVNIAVTAPSSAGATPSGTFTCSVTPVVVVAPTCATTLTPGKINSSGTGTFKFVGVVGTTYTIQVTYIPDATSSTTFTTSIGSGTVKA